MTEPGPEKAPNADPGIHLYQGAAGRAYHEGKRRLEPRALEWVCRLRAEKLQPWIRDTDVVFEMGVGSGWNLAAIRCARKVGCDAAGFLADRVRALGIEFHDDSRELPNAMADVVICHQTLEHFLEPPSALRELARLLKPEGRLVLHVPWETERRLARYRPDEPNHHFYHWTAQNLGNLLVVLGWNILSMRVRRYGYDCVASHWAVKLRSGEIGFRLLRRFLIALRPLREVEAVARR